MYRVLGGRKRLCDGITRRDLLHVGSLSVLGFRAAEWMPQSQAAAVADQPRFGQARACILLYLYGAPSQLETFDPKPDAPAEIRGELGTIPTVLPGVRFGEGLPRLAAVADKLTILRTVHHEYPIHGVAFATTGIPQMELAMELAPRDPRHWPYIGSVVDYVDERHGAGLARAIPGNLMLPWAFSTQRVGEVPRAGPYGGFLGSTYDPIATQFLGKGTRTARKTLQQMVWEEPEPYRGITPESRFQLSAVDDGSLSGLTLDRLDRRRTLLEQFEQSRPRLEQAAATHAEAGAISSSMAAAQRHRAMAHALLHSNRLRQAFDLDAEPLCMRERYGMTLFGQAALTARRLVEAGGRFVSVFWDEYGLAGTGWDTHWDHYERMRNELLPGLDQTVSALILDLDQRGMLDETLVLVLSEHGRTPRITPGQGGGRDHWSRCYSVVMAGGGVGRGRVIGRSDSIASDPVERPISPKDILATSYHLLGIDPETELRDRQGRPFTLVPTGAVLHDALG